MIHRLLLVVSFVLSALVAADAADQTILGKSLLVKDPSTPDKRKITIKAKELASPDTIVGDPVVDGASVTVTLTGVTPSLETYDLPAAASAITHKPFWSGDAARGFKYGDRKGENGPVKSLQIKAKNGVFQIKVAIDGKLAPVALAPPHPGSSGCVLLEITSGDSYSVRFAGGDVMNDGAVLFRIVNPVGEGTCVTTTTTTTTTSTTTTSTTTTSTTSTTTTTTTTTTSTTTTTLGLPYVPPPGPAPLRYRDDVFGAVSTTSNIVYGSAVNNSNQTVTLMLDLYEPVGDAVTERPAIIWIHGGSFSSGDKTSPELVDEANVFSKKGYVNMSINYRLEPGGCSAGGATLTCLIAITEAFEDAKTAVRFVRTNAATYGVDPDRIAIGGSSAGAITALNVGFSTTENPDAAVAAAVSLSGSRLIGAYDAGDAPSLLFHGTADVVVPYQWAVDTVNAATAVGLDSFLTSWPGAGHVPYVQHRTEILDQTRNFLYWEMDLANAAQ